MKAVGGWIFAGGFSLGVKNHFDIRCVLEEGAFGVVTARHNQPEIPVHVGIESWPIDQLKGEGELDFIYGNPPCFSSETRVLTENGRVKIKDLVDSKSRVRVASVTEDGRLVFKPITGWHDNPYRGDLYRVTRKNKHCHSARVDCTPNHRFLTKDGWKCAIDLVETDEVVTGTLAPSALQMDLINGMLLGDATIKKHTYQLFVSQTSHEYVALQRQALKEFVSDGDTEKEGVTWGGSFHKPRSWFYLRIEPWVKRERNRWYDENCKIRVPPDIVLNPITLAAWYMDDGTLRKSSRGGASCAHLCSDNFTQEDVDLLIAKLNEIGVEARRAGQGTGRSGIFPRVLITVAGMDRFISMIGPYVHPEMRYKLPEWAPAFDPSLWQLGEPRVDWDNVIVTKIEKLYDGKVYCLDVEDTHNFVTDAGVVHNCAAWSSAGGTAVQGKDWRIDPRVKCTRRLFHLLEELSPTVWAWESVVPAFTRGRELVDELTCRAIDLGYSVTYLFHNSMHLGVPQQRRRFFMVCSKVKFDVLEEFEELIPADALLASMNDPGEPLERDLKRFMPLLPYVKPGETMIKAWERVTPKPWPLNERGQVLGRPNITLGRCPIGRPSQVIMSELIHPTENRGLSMKELAALCGYPPDYEFVGSSPAQQLGRGVCPPVGEWLARNVRRCIERGDIDETPCVKSIDCRDPPIVTVKLPIPEPPEPGAAEKPWNYTHSGGDNGAVENNDTVTTVRNVNFGDYKMGLMPANNAYRSERSLTAEARSTISIPEGTVALEIPDNLSEDSLEDVKDFIELTMKRLERRMKRAKEAEAA